MKRKSRASYHLTVRSACHEGKTWSTVYGMDCVSWVVSKSDMRLPYCLRQTRFLWIAVRKESFSEDFPTERLISLCPYSCPGIYSRLRAQADGIPPNPIFLTEASVFPPPGQFLSDTTVPANLLPSRRSAMK